MLWKPLFTLGTYLVVIAQPYPRHLSLIPCRITASASTALARGITVLPGSHADTIVPLTLVGEGAGQQQTSNNNANNNAATKLKARQASSSPSSSSSSPVPLRIMPLGASVTFGIGSRTGNSYRKDLADLLVAAGQPVDFVGQFTNGDFTNNQVEATPGFVIEQIAGLASNATPALLPNLVLMDAGTNNCNQGGTVPDAGANVTAMINEVFAQSPGATVILAQLLVNKVAAQDACRVDVNRQYVALAAQMAAQGDKLVLVDMRSADGPTVSDLADERHPNDNGYQKMANVWFQGIQQAITSGFISAAADDGVSATGGEL